MTNVRRRRADHQIQVEKDAHEEEFVPETVQEQPEVLATNTGVRLACTMAAMMSVFALFLCHTEKESRVIRRYAVQSAALLILHSAVGGVLLAAGILLGRIPFFGLVITLVCWLIYIAVLVLLLGIRFRLMEHAWRGERWELPLLERLTKKYY